jgi:hypothetical protein
MSIRNITDSGLSNNIFLNASLDGSVIRENVFVGTIVTNVLTLSYRDNFSVVSVASPGANFTVNATNVPVDNNEIISMTIIITQGATGRIPNAFQIEGAAQTLRWVGNVVPIATNNKIDIFSFNLIRQSNAWVVLGQASLNF